MKKVPSAVLEAIAKTDFFDEKINTKVLIDDILCARQTITAISMLLSLAPEKDLAQPYRDEVGKLVNNYMNESDDGQ